MKAKLLAIISVLIRGVPLAVGAVVLVLSIAWLAGSFTPKVEPGYQAPPVRQWSGEPTDEVREQTKDYIEEALGTLRASRRTAISAKVLATILEITAVAGDQVEQGDVLIRVDNEALQSRVRQAEQVLAGTVATRKQAEVTYNRTKSLREKQAVPQADLDVATASLEVAQAAEQQATQSVNEAKTQLSYATIVAPKSGRVIDRFAEEGDTVRPGEPLLVLYDASSLRLEAPVQESLALQLREGQQLYVYLDATKQELQGTIDEIVPQADAPSRSLLVKVALPAIPNLYEGMFGRLRISAGTRKHVCLAEAAIRSVGQLEFVDAVLPDNTLERRMIKTGRVGIPGRKEVLSGLQPGDNVVLHAAAPEIECVKEDN